MAKTKHLNSQRAIAFCVEGHSTTFPEGQLDAVRRWCGTQRPLIEVVCPVVSVPTKAPHLDSRPDLLDALALCIDKKCGLLVACRWRDFALHKHVFAALELRCRRLGVRPVTLEGGLAEAPLERDLRQITAVHGSLGG